MSTLALTAAAVGTPISLPTWGRIVQIVRIALFLEPPRTDLLGSVLDVSERYTISRRGRDIHLVLRGHLTADDARESTEAFIELVGQDDVRFIVDLGDLHGYDSEARRQWTRVLRPLRKRITIIYFVGETAPLVGMAASAVAIAVGLYMKFVKTHADVPEDER